MSRVLDAVRRWAQEQPTAPALTDGAVTLSWAELSDQIQALAGRIAQSGAPADAPVAIALDNGADWVLADLALVALGRPCLPLPPFFSPQQRDHALADAGAGLLVGPAADGSLSLLRIDLPRRPLHPGTAKITYTSGSTGAPKGVCLSQDQIEAVAASLVEVIGVEFAGRHLAALPLGVLLENVAGLYPTLLAGGCYHAHPLADLYGAGGLSPDPRRLAEVAETARATSLILAPEMLRALTAVLEASGERLADLKFVAVGGAKVARQVIEAARRVGLPVYEGYGLSECGSVVALNTPGADRSGSVGRILPHLDVSLRDGEIVVGPRPFLGYVGGPPQAGPVATGDLGEIDAAGWLRITGRRSDLIVTGLGRNVAPEWVESELLAEPEIAQAAVFGEAAASLCALLVPRTARVDEAALDGAVSRANARLPAYARVERWRHAEPFDPGRGQATANGRPRRKALHAAYRDFIDQPA